MLKKSNLMPIFIINGASSSGKTTALIEMKKSFEFHNKIAFFVLGLFNLQKQEESLKQLQEFFIFPIELSDRFLLKEMFPIIPITFSDMDEIWINIPKVFTEFNYLHTLGLSFSSFEDDFKHIYGITGKEIIENRFYSLQKKYSVSVATEILCDSNFAIIKSVLNNKDYLIINMNIQESLRIKREFLRQDRPLGLTKKQSKSLEKNLDNYKICNKKFLSNLKIFTPSYSQSPISNYLQKIHEESYKIFYDFQNHGEIYNNNHIIKLITFILLNHKSIENFNASLTIHNNLIE